MNPESPPGLPLRVVQKIDVLTPGTAQPALSIPIISSCRVEEFQCLMQLYRDGMRRR
jgi:hypothetical protein